MIKSIEFDDNGSIKSYDLTLLSFPDSDLQMINELIISINSTDHSVIRSNKPGDIVFVKITTYNNTTVDIGFDYTGDRIYFLTFNSILDRIVKSPKITTIFTGFDHIYFDHQIDVYINETHHSFYIDELLKPLALIEVRDNWNVKLTSDEREEMKICDKISNYFLSLVNDTFKDYDPYKKYIYKIAKAILCFPDSEFRLSDGYHIIEAIVLLYLCSMAIEGDSSEVIVITRLELDRWDRSLSWLIMDTIENLGINLIYKRLF